MEAKQCAICERTLLVGELPLRFAPDGMDEYVDVCVLCQEVALDHGWVREGSPIGPAVRHTRRRRPLSLTAIFGAPRRPAAGQRGERLRVREDLRHRDLDLDRRHPRGGLHALEAPPA